VARSLQITADMRLTSAWPAAKIPAPKLLKLFLRVPFALVLRADKRFCQATDLQRKPAPLLKNQ